ncbi:hypothetical protein TTRE_0000555701 [Trichuris trichiura]|uniref:Uncharacterized protein n=1 Tax=Trichuris trichiura TaxID=36087 RepID=A0A077ZAH7_TRITR|nr:hypothetical protein TTRE_0000555701 [Trichuris trichiura]
MEITTYIEGRQRPVYSCAGIFCVHCASPRSTVKNNMLDAMDQLLNLRQTYYPYDVVNSDCAKLTNISRHQLQHCHYPICYSIYADVSGLPLVIRGCAESFLPPQPLKNYSREYCRSLQQSLNIVECVCPGKSYCGRSSPIVAMIVLSYIVLFSAAHSPCIIAKIRLHIACIQF